jgi:large subunit ribosomal protein L19
MGLIQQIDAQQLKTNLPQICVGDTVNVHMKVKEGEKERIQTLEGLVIRIGNTGMGKTVTVRKISFGVGVERIFPLHSPLVEKIEILKHARVRKARLYYIRDLKGKAARLKAAKKTPGGKKRAKTDKPA